MITIFGSDAKVLVIPGSDPGGFLRERLAGCKAEVITIFGSDAKVLVIPGSDPGGCLHERLAGCTRYKSVDCLVSLLEIYTITFEFRTPKKRISSQDKITWFVKPSFLLFGNRQFCFLRHAKRQLSSVRTVFRTQRLDIETKRNMSKGLRINNINVMFDRSQGSIFTKILFISIKT